MYVVKLAIDLGGAIYLRIYPTDQPQHDELEPNLKKILHRNGIWVLEAERTKFFQ